MTETIPTPAPLPPKPKSKLVAYVSKDICTGCEACMAVMPHDDCIAKIEASASVPFAMVPVEVANAKCTGCTLCMRICPWDAITMVPRPS